MDETEGERAAESESAPDLSQPREGPPSDSKRAFDHSHLLHPTASDLAELVNGVAAGSESDLAEKILKENLVPAVQELAGLAFFAKSEGIRLKASQYIVERNLGKIAERLQVGDVWEDLLKSIAKGPGPSEGEAA